MQKLRIINFFAGPSAGKSTIALQVSGAMKADSRRAELITEGAKDAVWEDHHFLLSQQVSLFADQLRRQARLIGKREVAVTDSPILLSALVYNKDWNHLAALAWEAWDRFDNINFFVRRVKPYDPEGRTQDLDGALEKDREAMNILLIHNVPFMTVDGSPEGAAEVVKFYNANYPSLSMGI